jgi:hypothetical protein
VRPRGQRRVIVTSTFARGHPSRPSARSPPVGGSGQGGRPSASWKASPSR